MWVSREWNYEGGVVDPLTPPHLRLLLGESSNPAWKKRLQQPATSLRAVSLMSSCNPERHS